MADTPKDDPLLQFMEKMLDSMIFDNAINAMGYLVRIAMEHCPPEEDKYVAAAIEALTEVTESSQLAFMKAGQDTKTQFMISMLKSREIHAKRPLVDVLKSIRSKQEKAKKEAQAAMDQLVNTK